MSVLNLNQANKLYFQNTEAQRLYRGAQQLFPILNPDPFFSNVVFFLRGNAVLDLSPNPKSITNNGVSISNDQPKYGNSSILFGASNSFLQVVNNDLVLGTQPFTVEAWVRKPLFSPSDNTINDGLLSFVGSGNPIISFFNDDLNLPVSIPNLFTNRSNQWIHLAYVRESTGTNASKVYLNGILVGQHTNSQNHTSNTMLVGRYSGVNNCLDGWLNTFRLTRGIARYTSNFNPETDTFLAY